VIAAIGSFAILSLGKGLSQLTVRHYLFFALLFGLGAFYFVLGRSHRQFRLWARTAAVVLCCIALGGLPSGTIVGGVFLYVPVKAKSLFSADELMEPKTLKNPGNLS
jgi:hypothetical protein